MKTLLTAFKTKDVRSRIIFTIIAIVIAQIGTYIPLPFINRDLIQILTQSSALSFLNAMTGGSLANMSIFALNITPYITASILIQLLCVIVPKLDGLKKQGEYGKKELKKYTIFITIGFALVQSIAMGIGFNKKGFLTADSVFVAVTVIAILLTASSVFLMYLGEKITEKGIGQGVSVIIAANIISRMPSDLIGLYNQFIKGKDITVAIYSSVVIIAIIISLIVFIVKLENSMTKVPIQHSTRMRTGFNNKQYDFIPLKTNTAGVMPVIFASSLMQMPILIAAVLGKGNSGGISEFILKTLNQSEWFKMSSFGDFKYTIGVFIYMALIIFFAHFYTSITFNSNEIADNLKKSDAIIPGIRPGKSTADYIEKILKKSILKGAVGVIIIVLIPVIISGIFGANVSFGGTSLIIVVSVITEIAKQIKTLSLHGNYRAFV